MSMTLTLKNIPDAVYERLKASAAVNRRSLNREAIVCLESVLLTSQLPARERLAQVKFLARDIDTLKRQGRA